MSQVWKLISDELHLKSTYDPPVYFIGVINDELNGKLYLGNNIITIQFHCNFFGF